MLRQHLYRASAGHIVPRVGKPASLEDRYVLRIPVESLPSCDLLGIEKPGGVAVTGAQAEQRVHDCGRAAIRQPELREQDIVPVKFGEFFRLDTKLVKLPQFAFTRHVTIRRPERG